MGTYLQEYSYELVPHSPAQGGGWLLRLLADGRELGERVFPPAPGIENTRLANAAAHDEALAAVTAWLASIKARDPSQRPRPADDGGMYLLAPDDWLLMPAQPERRPAPVVLDWVPEGSGDA
ncbi:hypothetical protein [Rhizobium binxianense]